MATVKGDVHDIGKNIVGVVLGCNNFEVIDMGVMVPANQILEKAKQENVDLIGLSGLITPSLDEMVHVAKEMQRLGFTIPLLIGGATTSRVHTAVKIAPHYEHGTIWVKDASRAVGVASQLNSNELKPAFMQTVNEEYHDVRTRHAGKKAAIRWVSLQAARNNAVKIDWQKYQTVKPTFLGTKSFDDYKLAELRDCIDWSPFFRTWELVGTYPAILDDKVVGESARSLFADAQAMLEKIITEGWLQAKAVIGLFPANSVFDDIEIYSDDGRTIVSTVLHHLRQQNEKPPGRPNQCLADFVAPRDSGIKDYIGAFAVTTGLRIDAKLKEFAEAHDDYDAIMLKALADRLAEALAESMHKRVRTEFWGYAADEQLGNEQLIKEQYQGIRPAAGYPACPDHTEKTALFELLQATTHTGIALTESMAMLPAASVSGFYFAHPDSHYFAVGKINRDQVEDYAGRKGMDIKEVERWLAPNLGYEPAN